MKKTKSQINEKKKTFQLHVVHEKIEAQKFETELGLAIHFN